MSCFEGQEIGKTYTQGTDHVGRPVIYIHVGKHRTYDQSPKALEVCDSLVDPHSYRELMLLSYSGFRPVPNGERSMLVRSSG
jgi:hypothetical protein